MPCFLAGGDIYRNDIDLFLRAGLRNVREIDLLRARRDDLGGIRIEVLRIHFREGWLVKGCKIVEERRKAYLLRL